MKLKVKNKKIVISCIIILIVSIIVRMYFYNKIKRIKDDAYIDIWRDTSMDPVHNFGLNSQPLHYLINENGEVYTYRASYKNEITGKKDSATIKYIKTISKSDLQKLENDLKQIIENNTDDSISYWYLDYWYIEINNNSTRVNVNVKSQVLDKYF